MRKWLSSLSYILATTTAILLLLPMLLGLLAERKCKQIVETLNVTTPLSAKIIDYQRGWFSANATAQISLDKLELPNKELHQLTITANIIHGPILIDWAKFQFVQAMVDAAIDLNATQKHWLKRDPDAQPIATIKIKFKLSGNTDITLDSPSLTYQNEENNLNWHGLKIRSIFSPLYNQVKSKIDFAGVDIKTKDRNVHLGEITSTYQGNKTSNNIWLGERNLQFTSFSTTNTDNRTISLGDLNIRNLVTSNEKNLANIATTITITNLNINGAAYSQNKLDLEINKMDQALLAKLQQQLISSKIISSPTSIGFDMIMAILNNGSEINIKQLDTTTPWGKLFTNIKMSFANQPNNIGWLATITNSTINTNIKAERALSLNFPQRS